MNNLVFHSFDKAPILARVRPGKILYDDGCPPLPGRAILTSARLGEREARRRGGETNGKHKDRRHRLTRCRDSHFDPVVGSQFYGPRKPIRFWTASNSRHHRGSNRGSRWAIPEAQEIVSWPSPFPCNGGSVRPESVLRARPIGRALLLWAVPRARLPLIEIKDLPLVGLWPTFSSMHTAATHPSPPFPYRVNR